MLILNGTTLGSNPCTFVGGTVYAVELPNWAKTGARRNIYHGEAGIDPLSGIPNGTEPPVSWLLPQEGGGLAAYTSIYGDGELTLDSLSMGAALGADLDGSGTISTALLVLIAALESDLAASGTISSATLSAQANLDAALSGSGSVSNAVLVLLYSMAADLSGSGTISTAALQSISSLAADLEGSGGVSAATLGLLTTLAASISGNGTVSAATLDSIMVLAAALSGSGTVSAASLSMIVSMLADIAASGGASGNLKGTLFMGADINVTGSALTTANIATSVWGALAVSNDDPGTMGEQLNNSGASGNPWDAVIESGFTAEQVLRILLAVAAGKSSVVVGVSGAATVTFRDTGDTTNRVVAGMQDSDRETVTLDPA